MPKKVTQNQWFDKTKGLNELLDNSEKLTAIECPKCKEMVEFYPDELFWDADEDFEFCDVICPECDETFEINAASESDKYSFFTTD